MDKFGAELEKEKKTVVQKRILDLWEECSSPEQFFLELAVKVPEASKLDVLLLKRYVFAKKHPVLDELVDPVVLVASCFAVGCGLISSSVFGAVVGIVLFVVELFWWASCISRYEQLRWELNLRSEK